MPQPRRCPIRRRRWSSSPRSLRRTLAALLQDLGDGFVRTHRSAAVAVAHVQQLQLRDSGDATVQLSGGQEAPCSRQFRAALAARLAR